MILTVVSCISHLSPAFWGWGVEWSGSYADKFWFKSWTERGRCGDGLVSATLLPSGLAHSICVCLHTYTQAPEEPVRNIRRGVLCRPYLVGSHEFPFWLCPRVYLLYHTWSQVFYGGVAGGLMAIAWFVITQEILTPLFPRIAAW